jgi:sugar lactone lactonase YvrE
MSLAADASGNLYIGEWGNYRVRKLAPNGIITTVAGNGSSVTSGDNGLATNAGLYPTGIGVDPIGNLYIADGNNNVVRKVGTNGIITTVAGNGTPGYSGDGFGATSAQLNTPAGVAADAAGNIYIADAHNNVVRKVAANGTITTVAGTGSAGYLGDNGPATKAQLNEPESVRLDAAGNLYIADSENSRIRKVALDGTITTVAGSWQGYYGDGGPATSADLYYPADAVVDATGNMYIADYANNVIRKVAANGIISTVAGNGSGTYSGDGGLATHAQFYLPNGVAVDGHGNLVIADTGNSAVRKVAANGIVTRVGDVRSFGGPEGAVFDAAGNFYVADFGSEEVLKVAAADGTITTVAGIEGIANYSGDGGPATAAKLDMPWGVALDAAGNLYIATKFDNRVRKVAGNGNISTVAGNGSAGQSGDGGQATSAQLNSPQGVAVDAAGNLYIADTFNNAVRKVTPGGVISTVAGTLGPAGGYSGDGGQATRAHLSWPQAVAVDAAGNLYIADTLNNVIRKVATNGIISTVAGNHVSGYSGDGGPATSAQLNSPQGLAVDAGGRIYIADTNNFAIRLLTPVTNYPVVGLALTHAGNFTGGQMGATYSVVVSNTGTGPTTGTVTVQDSLPYQFTLVSMAGTGWSCSGNTCTRSDALGPASSYPPITVTVNVAGVATVQVTNQAGVSGGGSTAATANDPTTIIQASTTPTLVSPVNGATGVLVAPTLVWNAVPGAYPYSVSFGTQSPPFYWASANAASYAPGTLDPNTTYYWQIQATTSYGSGTSPIWSFTTGTPAVGSQFIPVAPCRVADTRNAAGLFGGPTMAGGQTRSFAIPQSNCGIPATAQAYSLNVTVVPNGPLGYLSLWPTGQAQPGVSTLNSWGGAVVANAAIVPAGTGGAVSVFVSDSTNVILDINGYFDSTGSAFYPATPCRVADTRNTTGQFGGPSMFGGQTRNFPVPLSSCGIPSTSSAYAMNVTVVPGGALGYLSTWGTGQAQPYVSTLNSWTGKVVANAAIVPAGTNESISVFVSNPTDVILDINGYFGPSGGAGALNFYPVTPCRVADTRNAFGPFGGPEMAAGTTRSFAIPASSCNVPSTAAAYSVNVTVVPDGALGYLSAWQTGATQPNVSTLNSWDGSVVANAAIVPAGTGGAISVFVTNPTNVILDINGYFAP